VKNQKIKPRLKKSRKENPENEDRNNNLRSLESKNSKLKQVLRNVKKTRGESKNGK